MQTSRHRLLAAAAVFAALASGPASADDTRVPQTGSEQGEIVPSALPGGEPPHARAPQGHLISPTGIMPLGGSEQGMESPNSTAGSRALLGEAQPHSDVTSQPGLVPNGSEGAPGVSNPR